jgi:hypothetical protein
MGGEPGRPGADGCVPGVGRGGAEGEHRHFVAVIDLTVGQAVDEHLHASDLAIGLRQRAVEVGDAHGFTRGA